VPAHSKPIRTIDSTFCRMGEAARRLLQPVLAGMATLAMVLAGSSTVDLGAAGWLAGSAVLRRIERWGWVGGISPTSGAPTWRMSASSRPLPYGLRPARGLGLVTRDLAPVLR
jgi:hypothetical protein